MKYFYEHNAPRGGKFLKVERNMLNPLPGRSFVSIAYYQCEDGSQYAVIF